MSGTPTISGLTGKVQVVERKIAYARDQLARGSCSETSAQWYRREIEAFEAALVALRLHRALLAEGGLLPLVREVVDAYAAPPGTEIRLRDAVASLRLALQQIDGS